MLELGVDEYFEDVVVLELYFVDEVHVSAGYQLDLLTLHLSYIMFELTKRHLGNKHTE